MDGLDIPALAVKRGVLRLKRVSLLYVLDECRFLKSLDISFQLSDQLKALEPDLVILQTGVHVHGVQLVRVLLDHVEGNDVVHQLDLHVSNLELLHDLSFLFDQLYLLVFNFLKPSPYVLDLSQMV